MKNLAKTSVLIFLIIFISQCVAVDRRPPAKSPPPWAPAHGVRAKYAYHYYPASYIYYDATRRLYFYFQGGAWVSAVSLPPAYLPLSGEFVIIEMDDDRPYKYYEKHKKQYPPGKYKPHKWK